MMILSPNVGPVTKYPVNVGIGPVIRSVLADYTPDKFKFQFISDSGYIQTPFVQFTGIDNAIVLQINSGCDVDDINVTAYIGQINNDPYAETRTLSSGVIRPPYDLVTIKPGQWLSISYEDLTGFGATGTTTIRNSTINPNPTFAPQIDSFNWELIGGV